MKSLFPNRKMSESDEPEVQVFDDVNDQGFQTQRQIHQTEFSGELEHEDCN